MAPHWYRARNGIIGGNQGLIILLYTGIHIRTLDPLIYRSTLPIQVIILGIEIWPFPVPDGLVTRPMYMRVEACIIDALRDDSIMLPMVALYYHVIVTSHVVYHYITIVISNGCSMH